MDWIGLFFAPIKPFVAHPERAAAVATALLIIFLTLGSVRQVWPWSLLWAAIIWAIYTIWEWIILLQEANIRVDLLLIYPMLLVSTLWALWSTFRPRPRA
jgi:membrane-associated phospholipid phosphatase